MKPYRILSSSPFQLAAAVVISLSGAQTASAQQLPPPATQKRVAKPVVSKTLSAKVVAPKLAQKAEAVPYLAPEEPLGRAKTGPAAGPLPKQIAPSPEKANTPDVTVLDPSTEETDKRTQQQTPPKTTTPKTTTPKTTPKVVEPKVAEPKVTEPKVVEPKTEPVKVASVGGVRVSGLKEATALRKLRRELAPLLRKEVTLFDGESEYSLRRDELGTTIPYATLLKEARKTGGDVPVRFAVDLVQARRGLRKLALKINRKGGKSSLDLDEKNQVVFKGSEKVEMAVSGSALRIQKALEAQVPQSRVELVVARDAIGGTSEAELKKIRYILAAYSTPYDAKIVGRTTNLRMAAELVNGTIVPAGAVFSTNKTIGPRRASAGWKEAKMFVAGQIVSGVGSGICQGSSTLYNAALLAGLPIVERHPHMFRVSYVPASRDAAIYWGSKDMRFRNNTKGPIYVQTFLKGGRFHVRLFGTEPVTKEVEVTSRVLSEKKGVRSESYRIIKTATGTVKERLARDYYMPHP